MVYPKYEHYHILIICSPVRALTVCVDEAWWLNDMMIFQKIKVLISFMHRLVWASTICIITKTSFCIVLALLYVFMFVFIQPCQCFFALTWGKVSSDMRAQQRLRSDCANRSLIWVFTVHCFGHQGSNVSSDGQWRHWSDRRDAQADLSLCRVHVS